MRDQLTEEEKEFIAYWEKEGKKEKIWTHMIKRHLPKGLIFSLPIALFFFIMGPKRRAIVTHSELVIIMVCVFLIAVAYSILKGHVKNDRLETYYQLLKMKDAKNHITKSAHHQ